MSREEFLGNCSTNVVVRHVDEDDIAFVVKRVVGGFSSRAMVTLDSMPSADTVARHPAILIDPVRGVSKFFVFFLLGGVVFVAINSFFFLFGLVFIGGGWVDEFAVSRIEEDGESVALKKEVMFMGEVTMIARDDPLKRKLLGRSFVAQVFWVGQSGVDDSLVDEVMALLRSERVICRRLR